MLRYLIPLALLCFLPRLSAADTVVPPKLTKRVEAEFPWALKMAFMHPSEPAKNGTAKVEFVVGVTGKVEDAKIVAAAHPEMGPPALAAVKKWKFKPGSENGKPRSALMQVEVWFGLVEEPGKRGPEYDPVFVSFVSREAESEKRAE